MEPQRKLAWAGVDSCLAQSRSRRVIEGVELLLGADQDGSSVVEAEVPHFAAQFFHPPGRRQDRRNYLIRYRCEAELRLDGFDDPRRGEVIRLSFVEQVPQGNVTRPSQGGVAGNLALLLQLDANRGPRSPRRLFRIPGTKACGKLLVTYTLDREEDTL